MKIETTTDLIDRMRERGNFPSDQRLAIGLKIPQNTVSSWRTGRTYPTEVHALKIAEFLKINPALVLAVAAADRTRGRVESQKWKQVAAALARAA